MINLNRRRTHGRHGSKRRELEQHAHSRGSHADNRYGLLDLKQSINQSLTHVHQHSYNHVVRSASSAFT